MTEAAVDPSPLPFWGTGSDKTTALKGGAAALALVLLYVVVARAFDTPTSLIEGVSLWSSLACVWLARVENIWTMPYGLVAVLLLGWYLLDIGLVGQGWLQYLFYVPVQVYAWWKWCRGGHAKTELKVTRLTLRGWLLTLSSLIAIWVSCWLVFGALYEKPAWLAWDTSIVASSIVAQSLMTWKKREAWWAWSLPVNVSSIGLFIVTESYAFVFLYVIFLVNSIYGWAAWHRAALQAA